MATSPNSKWLTAMIVITVVSVVGTVLIQVNKQNGFLEARQELVNIAAKTASDKMAIETYVECYSEKSQNLRCQYDAIKTAELLVDNSNTEDIKQSLSKFVSAYEELKEIRGQ